MQESEFPPLASDDALLIVDLQNDFLPGGSLAVPEGDQVIPVINRCIDRFRAVNGLIVATRDWHPSDHCSFQEQGGMWPRHCVQQSQGARFAATLRLPAEAWIISKASGEQDAYSGFDGTHLAQRLRQAGVQRLFIAGLATDYCVLQTVLDGLNEGFQVYLLEDGVRAVNLDAGDGDRALDKMRAAGATLLQRTGID